MWSALGRTFRDIKLNRPSTDRLSTLHFYVHIPLPGVWKNRLGDINAGAHRRRIEDLYLHVLRRLYLQCYFRLCERFTQIVHHFDLKGYRCLRLKNRFRLKPDNEVPFVLFLRECKPYGEKEKSGAFHAFILVFNRNGFGAFAC